MLSKEFLSPSTAAKCRVLGHVKSHSVSERFPFFSGFYHRANFPYLSSDLLCFFRIPIFWIGTFKVFNLFCSKNWISVRAVMFHLRFNFRSVYFANEFSWENNFSTAFWKKNVWDVNAGDHFWQPHTLYGSQVTSSCTRWANFRTGFSLRRGGGW